MRRPEENRVRADEAFSHGDDKVESRDRGCGAARPLCQPELARRLSRRGLWRRPVGRPPGARERKSLGFACLDSKGQEDVGGEIVLLKNVLGRVEEVGGSRMHKHLDIEGGGTRRHIRWLVARLIAEASTKARVDWEVR